MYLQFYGFKELPFNLTPDSKFLFLSHRHQEALAALLFGVQERKGFIVLTGDIGCGKTTLCRAMLSQLDPEQVKVCVVLNSYLTDIELLKTVNEGFGLPADTDSKKSLLDHLNGFLVEEFGKGHNVVLIIDEAQNLRPETLEQIRMISNLETETAKLIQIVLVGQPELRRTLSLPELEQLNQRITVRYHITPLEEPEIPDYIKHRLAVAEPSVEIAFTPQAHRLIHHYSKGVPRRINVICDRCLLVGYIQGTFNIDDKLAQRAINEVRGESGSFASAAGAGGDRAAGGFGGGAFATILAKLGTALAYLLVIAGGVLLGVWLYDRRDNARAEREVVRVTDVMPYPTATPLVERVVNPAAREEAPAPATTDSEAAPTPTPTPSPTPSPTPLQFENWQTDPDGVLRVREANLAEAAAYINLIRAWDIIVDLPLFQNANPAEVAQWDMLAMMKQLNFDAVVTEELSEALRLDMPVAVQLDGGEGFAPWGVILRMGGEVLDYIDPIHGRRSLQRSKLEPIVKRAIVLYQDPNGFAGISGGEESERVRKLQALLATEGFFQGTADGKFGPRTREAIQGWQQKLGLEPTGVIDRLTAAALANRLNSTRPRLYS